MRKSPFPEKKFKLILTKINDSVDKETKQDLVNIFRTATEFVKEASSEAASQIKSGMENMKKEIDSLTENADIGLVSIPLNEEEKTILDKIVSKVEEYTKNINCDKSSDNEAIENDYRGTPGESNKYIHEYNDVNDTPSDTPSSSKITYDWDKKKVVEEEKEETTSEAKTATSIVSTIDAITNAEKRLDEMDQAIKEIEDMKKEIEEAGLLNGYEPSYLKDEDFEDYLSEMELYEDRFDEDEEYKNSLTDSVKECTEKVNDDCIIINNHGTINLTINGNIYFDL